MTDTSSLRDPGPITAARTGEEDPGFRTIFNCHLYAPTESGTVLSVPIRSIGDQRISARSFRGD